MKSQLRMFLFAFLLGTIECAGQQPGTAVASKETATQKATDKASAGKKAVAPAENADAAKKEPCAAEAGKKTETQKTTVARPDRGSAGKNAVAPAENADAAKKEPCAAVAGKKRETPKATEVSPDRGSAGKSAVAPAEETGTAKQEPPTAVAGKKRETPKATEVGRDRGSAGKSAVAPAEKTDATMAMSGDTKISKAAYQQIYTSAIASYKQQSIDAHQSRDHKQEVAVALSTARAAETLAATDVSQIPVATAAYRSAIAAAKEPEQGEERSLAANNLAVLLMKSGKNQEALEAVKEIGFPPSLSPQQRAVFSYNIARTYELNGDRKQAFQKYADAYASNPDLTQAAVRGFRLLSTDEAVPIGDAVKLSDRVIASGHASIAHEQLLALIRRSATANDAQQLLAALVRCYVAESLSPPNFRGGESKKLAEAVGESPSLTQAVDQVNVAYFAKLSAAPFHAAGQFSMWSGQQWKSTTFALLLNVAAHWFTENHQPEQALARHMAAWNLTRDPQYAMEFASLLRLRPMLDPGGKLLDGLIDSMFMEKGDSYERQDWASIFQLHVAIGTILERDGKWGANGEVRGAIFQWKHAIVAYDRLHAKNPSAPPAPGLHAHLAACYSKTNQPQLAAREFLLAADGFVATGDIEEARSNVEPARRGAATLPTEDLKRLQKVEDALTGIK